MRISTPIGIIDVTEDHSLFNKNMERLSPKDAKIGDELRHLFPSSFFANNITITSLSTTYAYILGIFHANGYADENLWYITGQDIGELGKILVYMRALNTENGEFKIFAHMQDIYKLAYIGNGAALVDVYADMLYDKYGYKIIPSFILNASKDVRKAYWNGFYVGSKTSILDMPINNMYSTRSQNKVNIQHRGKTGTQGLYYLLHSLGYTNIQVSLIDGADLYQLNIIESVKDYYSMMNGDRSFDKNSEISNYAITSTCILSDDQIMDEYVYDIETTAGSFLGGVGSMIVSNTDSLYISMQENNFEQIDKDYYTEKISKLDYWTKMVETTFKTIHPLAKEVNTMLADNNGTTFLKMAYEEVLFPLLLLAKKKYIGVPHEKFIKFGDDAKLFIKGLELKKRGVAKVTANICLELSKQLFSYENILTFLEIIKTKISEFYNTRWTSLDDYESLFIMTDSYKPKKQNVKMHTFYNRMLAERNIKLSPHTRVQYIVVKKYPYKFDLRGRKKELSVGERIELADNVRNEKIPIDIDYYMEKSIIGQFARFITYIDEFYVEIQDLDDVDELKKADSISLERAKKYIHNYCKQYYTNYSNKGKIYKKVFTKSKKLVHDKLTELCGNTKASNTIIKLLGFSTDPDENLEGWFDKKVIKIIEAKKKNKEYGKRYVEYLLASNDKPGYIVELQSIYYARRGNNILDMATANYNERQTVLKMRFNQSLSIIKGLYYANNDVIEQVSNHIKEVIDIDNSFNDPVLGIKMVDDDNSDNSDDDNSDDANNIDSSIGSNSQITLINSSNNQNTKIDITDITDIDSYIQIKNGGDVDKSLSTIADAKIQQLVENISSGINELKFTYFNLLSNYEYIYQIRSIVDHLKQLRDKKLGISKYPTKSEREQIIKDTVDDMLKDNEHLFKDI
jgi:hypothetical protein